MNKEAKRTIVALASQLKVVDSYAFFRRKLTKSQVAILMYHRVCPKRDNWSLEPLSPQSFEEQIEYLCRNYEILSLDALAEYLRQGKSLPERAVIITFDDGYRDNYLYAYPVLTEYHVPATIFLCTGHVGTKNLFWWDKVSYIIQHTAVNYLDLYELGNYSFNSGLDRSGASFVVGEGLKKLSEERKDCLIENLLSVSGVDIPGNLGKELILSWDEVKEMSRNGISFGAHSVNHPLLTNIPVEQARWEVIQSKRDIEEQIGEKVTAFAYPNGNYNTQIAEIVKSSGFTCGVATYPATLITSKANPYQLSRIAVGEDFNIFKLILCGLYHDLKLNRFS